MCKRNSMLIIPLVIWITWNSPMHFEQKASLFIWWSLPTASTPPCTLHLFHSDWDTQLIITSFRFVFDVSVCVFTNKWIEKTCDMRNNNNSNYSDKPWAQPSIGWSCWWWQFFISLICTKLIILFSGTGAVEISIVPSNIVTAKNNVFAFEKIEAMIWLFIITKWCSSIYTFEMKVSFDGEKKPLEMASLMTLITYACVCLFLYTISCTAWDTYATSFWKILYINRLRCYL